jgi:hypothetical protein
MLMLGNLGRARLADAIAAAEKEQGKWKAFPLKVSTKPTNIR